MSEAAIISQTKAQTQVEQTKARPIDASTECWLALTLTPGLGPTRARKLVEHFGGV